MNTVLPAQLATSAFNMNTWPLSSLFIKTEDQRSLALDAQSTTTHSSPDHSPSTSPRPLKRGRPQQEIDDAADAGSQRRKHRRLYAREYRAQMRKKVDEVETLRQQVADLQRDRALLEARQLESDVQKAKLELALSDAAQREAILCQLLTQNLLGSLQSQQQPTVPSLFPTVTQQPLSNPASTSAPIS